MPNQATGSPRPPTWAPHGPVQQAAGQDVGSAAAAKQLDKIPSCLFDTIRQEVMTPKELWQLREVRVHRPLSSEITLTRWGEGGRDQIRGLDAL
jgi:hypothetical protein